MGGTWRRGRSVFALGVLGALAVGSAEALEKGREARFVSGPSATEAMPARDRGLARLPEVAFPGRRGEARKVGYYVADRLVEVLDVEVIDGRAVFQGDLVFPLGADGNIRIGSFLDEVDLPAKSTGRSNAALLWTSRVVPFRFHASVDATMQGRINDALNHWRSNSRLTFVARTNEAAFITFRQDSSGCFSTAVGRTGAEQTINVDSNCSTGNAIHEIGHAVGLWHEHQRVDRGNSIIINFANIAAGAVNNFQTYAALGQNGADYGAFDFGSIMMYPWNAFSVNGQATITKLDGSLFAVQRNGLSAGDKSGINCSMYAAPVSVSLSCSGNYRGSLQISCTASAPPVGLPITYSWTYNGTAYAWSSGGQYAYAYYNSPGCGYPTNQSTFNRFTVTVTDGCTSATASVSSLPCF